MSYCELCGSQITGEVVRVTIENVTMHVCRRCSRHGRPYVSKERGKGKERKPRETFSVRLQTVRDDYSKLIKDAREKMGLSQDELAKRMAADGAVVKLLEMKKFKPDQEMAKKLEELLGISLVEEEVHE
jgi:putative transcription factor